MEITKEQLEASMQKILAKADLTTKKAKLAEMEKQTYEASFWQDPQAAGEVMKEINTIKKEIDDIEMMQLLIEDNDLVGANKMIKEYEVLLFLSGEFDRGDAIFGIHAGQGGTEAMDWTGIL